MLAGGDGRRTAEGRIDDKTRLDRTGQKRDETGLGRKGIRDCWNIRSSKLE